MDDYKPNSHKYKQEQSSPPSDRKKLDKVVNGTVKTKKKSELTKFTEVFIPEDISNIKNYILLDVLVPAIKNTIEDIITNGIRMLLRGEAGSRKPNSTASSISYNRYYDQRRYSEPNTVQTRNGYNYNEIILETRGEAEEVLTRMDEAIDTYGLVSVADLYDLVGITGNYTDNKYGWTNIRNAEIIRVREGYMIKMPKALPIN